MRRTFISLLTLWLLSFSQLYVQGLESLDHYYQNRRQWIGNAQFSLAVLDLSTGKATRLGSQQPMPLASVMKVPLMIAVLSELEQQGINPFALALTYEDSDLCIGSGELQYRKTPFNLSVWDSLSLMMSISDNSAADRLLRFVTPDKMNVFTKQWGLNSMQIYLSNRQAWMLSLRQVPNFRGRSAKEIALYWNQLDKQQKEMLSRQALHPEINLAQFQSLEDRSYEQASDEDNMILAGALDNLSSSWDLTRLLAKLDRFELVGSINTKRCYQLFQGQKYHTRIPRFLPANWKVWHKTGTLAGIRNDIGIIQAPNGRRIALSLLTQNVAPGLEKSTDEFLGLVTKAVSYEYQLR